jgi:hypothetical protein
VFRQRDRDLCEKHPNGTVFKQMAIGVGDDRIFDSSRTDKHKNLLKLKVDKKNNAVVQLLGFLVPAPLPPSQVFTILFQV